MDGKFDSVLTASRRVRGSDPGVSEPPYVVALARIAARGDRPHGDCFRMALSSWDLVRRPSSLCSAQAWWQPLWAPIQLVLLAAISLAAVWYWKMPANKRVHPTAASGRG